MVLESQLMRAIDTPTRLFIHAGVLPASAPRDIRLSDNQLSTFITQFPAG